MSFRNSFFTLLAAFVYLPCVFMAKHDYALPSRNVSLTAVRKGCTFSDVGYHPVLDEPLILASGIILDVGANDGSNLARPSVHTEGARVISFEPQISLAHSLFEKVKANAIGNKKRPIDDRPPTYMLEIKPGSLPLPNHLSAAAEALAGPHGGIVVVNGAASDTVSAMPLYASPKTGTKMVSLAPGNMPKYQKGGQRNTLDPERGIAQKIGSTAVFPLDALFEGDSSLRRFNVSLLKIDAQGYEAHIIRGSKGIISTRINAIQLEFCPKMIHEASKAAATAGQTTQNAHHAAVELLDMMRLAGKACYQISPQAKGMKTQDLDHAQTFEDFVDAHFGPGCPVLGCATELLCLPARSAALHGGHEDIEAVETVMRVAGCSRNNGKL